MSNAKVELEAVELMDRQHFWSLSQPVRDEWAQRLKDQWGFELTDTVQWWFDGDRITGVLRYRRNAEGRLYGAVQLFGVAD